MAGIKGKGTWTSRARHASRCAAPGLLAVVFLAAVTVPVGAADDPLRSGQYALDKMRISEAWQATTGSGTVVAILDTGVDAMHEDLAGKVIPGRDYVDKDEDPQDASGHGTELAGIVAAVTGNGVGVSGTAPAARILSFRVVDETGGWSDGVVATAVRGAVERASRLRMNLVILLGLADLPGLAPPSSLGRATEGAVADAFRAGAVVVVASGVVAPSVRDDMAPHTLWVGASDEADRRVLLPGSEPDVLAPGIGIVTTTTNPDRPEDHAQYTCRDRRCQEGTVSGTSYAAAHAAGVAALLAGQGHRPAAVLSRLVETADQVTGRTACRADEACARINAGRATGVIAAGSSSTPAPVLPGVFPAPGGATSPGPASAAPSARPRVAAPAASRAPAQEPAPQEEVLALAESPEPVRRAPPATGVSPDRPVAPSREFPLAAATAAAGALTLVAVWAWRRRPPDPSLLHRAYDPAYEGMRGLAVVAVVAFHVLVLADAGGDGLPAGLWPVAAGNLGVDLFFVLSGYLLLLSWNSARRSEPSGRPAISSYARRRALRILPLFWFSLAVLVPLRAPALLSVERAGDLALLATVQQYLVPTLPWEVNGVTWSLTTEVHFYLVLPALAVALRRLGPIRLFGVLVAVSVGWRIAVSGTGLPADWIVGRIDQFGAGMAAAVLATSARHPVTRAIRSARGGRVLGGAIVAVVVAYGGLYGASGVNRSAWAEIAVHPVMGLLLAAFLVRIRGVRSPLLASPAMRFFGLISYSLYLWHVPALEAGGWMDGGMRGWAVLAVLLVASISLSTLTYLYIERPGMRLRLRGSASARAGETAQAAKGRAPGEPEPAGGAAATVGA